jgi:hypothetical protein
VSDFTEPQRLQLELIRLAGRGDVADTLVEHRNLWSGALITRAANPFGLVSLRDLERGFWNADTLYVLSTSVDDPALEQLAGQWEPDSIHWIDGMEAATKLGEYKNGVVRRVLEVWWD